MIAAGCILFALVLLDRLLYGYVISVEGTNSISAAALTTFYWIGETFAVLTVSAGLLLPRLAFHLNHGAFGIRSGLMLLQIGPIWTRVAAGQDKLILAKRPNKLTALSRHPETQLHRRLVEIRDCEMASPDTNGHLSTQDRAVVERAEHALERHAGAR